MNENERQALAQGYERMSAWARLLDRINVFPVADGDTGRNLVVSLAPLRRLELSGDKLMRALLLSARGNSGNIAARFMEGLLQSGDVELSLPERVSRGRDLAHTAVADPKPGTMLTLLDELTAGLEHGGGLAGEAAAAVLMQRLERSVHETTAQLPALQEAKVVDAGALGLFLLFETFIWSLIGAPGRVREVKEAFPAMVAFSPVAAEATADHGFCVDAVLRAADLDERSLRGLAELGDSAVTLSHGEYVKVHLHTDDQDALRARLEGFGPVVQWRWDDLEQQTRSYSRARPEPCLHVMTDAAGSFTRDQAEELGVTLLCSYINVSDDLSLPETHLDPSELYGAMGRGVKVSTSQASVHERHQHYQRLLGTRPRVLYLCVGSVFTGNHQVVSDWQAEHDPEGRLTIIDSAAASGKLGICALATARKALAIKDPDEVERYARRSLERAEEYIYIDKLQYLAAGGRLSKGSAFFGDLLHLKPIVSPTGEGAKKVGMTRSFKDQLAHAMARLEEGLAPGGAGALIMLEHTDNAGKVGEEVLPRVQERYPEAEVWLQPVSLTSGAHMGPGTWAVAFLAQEA